MYTVMVTLPHPTTAHKALFLVSCVYNFVTTFVCNIICKHQVYLLAMLQKNG